MNHRMDKAATTNATHQVNIAMAMLVFAPDVETGMFVMTFVSLGDLFSLIFFQPFTSTFKNIKGASVNSLKVLQTLLVLALQRDFDFGGILDVSGAPGADLGKLTDQGQDLINSLGVDDTPAEDTKKGAYLGILLGAFVVSTAFWLYRRHRHRFACLRGTIHGPAETTVAELSSEDDIVPMNTQGIVP